MNASGRNDPSVDASTQELGAPSSKRAEQWQRAYELLLRYVQREGTAKVPSPHREEGFHLGAWVSRQYHKWWSRKLPGENAELLERLPGWSWGRSQAPEPPVVGTDSETTPQVEHAIQKGSHEWEFIEANEAYRCDLVWNILLGLGPLSRSDAIRVAIDNLLLKEFKPSLHLKPLSPMTILVEKAITRGLHLGRFDRPEWVIIRAVFRDGSLYTPDDWRGCLLASRSRKPLGKEETLRRAIGWAVTNMGLTVDYWNTDADQFGGLVDVLDRLIEEGEIEVSSERTAQPDDK